MLRSILRLAVIVIFVGLLAVPFYFYAKHNLEENRLKAEEKDAIGSTYVLNPHVQDIQRILGFAKYYSGPVDGTMSQAMREAIESFQKSSHLQATGYVDKKTLSAISKEEALIIAEQQRQQALLAAANAAQNNTNAAPEAEGTNVLEEAVLASIDTNEHQDTLALPAAGSLDRARAIQTALKKSGFYGGEIDGKLGKQTKLAIRRFQVSRSLKADGVVGPKTWNELQQILKTNQ